MTTTIQIDKQALIRACAQAGIDHTRALRIMAYLPPIPGAAEPETDIGIPTSGTPQAIRESEGAALLAALFNVLTIKQKNSMPPGLQPRIGRFMNDNGYCAIFNDFYMKVEPKSSASDAPSSAPSMDGKSVAQRTLEFGQRHPYDGPNSNPAMNWTIKAARGVLADLSDRRGIKWELERVDQDVRADIVTVLAAIIKAAADEPPSTASQIDPRQALPHRRQWQD